MERKIHFVCSFCISYQYLFLESLVGSEFALPTPGQEQEVPAGDFLIQT